MALHNFGVIDTTERHVAARHPARFTKLFRCAAPSMSGIEDLRSLGVKRILKLSAEPLHRDASEMIELHRITIQTAAITLPAVSPGFVLRLLKSIRLSLISGVTVALVDRDGRSGTAIVAGAWRMVYGFSTLSDAFDEVKEYGGEWLPAASLTALRECLEDISEHADAEEESKRA